MTVRRICGFELGLLSLANGGGEVNTASAGNISISTTIKRTGDYALRVNPATTGIGFIGLTGFATNGTAQVFLATNLFPRIYIYVVTRPAANSEEIAQVIGSAGVKMTIRLTSDGKLQAYASDGTTQLGSDGTTVIPLNTWTMIEAKCGTGSVNGPYEVKINGTSELSGTGNLTDGTGSELYIGKATNRNGQGYDIYFDDVCIDDAAYPGPGQVEYMGPTGNGNYTSATIGAGTGQLYQQVDERPGCDTTTSYLLTTQVIDEKYTAALESAANAGISGTIKAVQASTFIIRNGAGANAAVLFRSGTTDSESVAFGSQLNWQMASKIFETDPATSAAWAVSALDSIEIGITEKDNGTKTQLSWVGAFVDFVPAESSGGGGSKGKKPPFIKPPKGGGGGGKNNPNFRHKIWILDD